MGCNDSARSRSDSPVGLRPCRGCGEEFFFAAGEDYCTYACEVAHADGELEHLARTIALPGSGA